MKVRRIHSELRETVASYDARSPLTSAASVAETFGPLIANEPVENFAAVLLNGKHRPIGWQVVSVGTLTASLVHPREVFGPAVRLGAAAIIVMHNHPSGDPSPSPEDLEVTKRLGAAGELLGIPLLDHVTIGADGKFRSLREVVTW